MLQQVVDHINIYLIATLCLVLIGCDPTTVDTKDSGAKQDQFSMHIRTAPAQSPAQEQMSFKLPEGFKIELFASEPDIGKPMNISFDARGRLWVTQSGAYPFQDSTANSVDKISILEDTNNDGKADKFVTFADSLNIPIGILPVAKGAIAYSIPNVYHLVDSDGDDRADQRKILLSGFESKDTHGMVNNFFRGLDGWIHADHGFSNSSSVVGTDNKAPLIMKSGNTFRFRDDGSGVSFTTTGRVNPFGYAMDEYGYWYSVDCHSSPLYQLIRGADYPHFGKKPTGIGFGPAMMPHNYGSTALAGLEYYTGSQFPVEFQNNFYLGDVVKSRVYRASISMSGTTPVADWKPDFIISEDPWFRPVDVKLGPDGALYIADFYNRIIGHYEVPLDHPGRDRERGRIWRITYDSSRLEHKPVNWENAKLAELIVGLNQPSLTVRMMVADQIVDRFGDRAEGIVAMLDEPEVTTTQYVHGLWVLYRLGKIDQQQIESGLTSNSEPVQVHTLRILFEMNSLNEEQLAQVQDMTSNKSPHIQRAAVMILGQYPSDEHVQTLLDLHSKIADEDTHMAYAIKQCLRDNLRDPGTFRWVLNQDWTRANTILLSQAMMGVDDFRSAVFMASHLDQFQVEHENMTLMISHITRYLPETDLNGFAENLRRLTPDEEIDMQLKFLESMQRGFDQRGLPLSHYSKQWSVELAGEILNIENQKDSLSDEALNRFTEQQVFACQVAKNYQVEDFSDRLKQLMVNQEADPVVRSHAGGALLAISSTNASDLIAIAIDTTENEPVREGLLTALLDQQIPKSTIIVGKLLPSFSFDNQKKLVASLVNNSDGIDEVIKAAESLDISPKMLLDPSINAILTDNMTSPQNARFSEITKNLTPFSNEIAFTIRTRLSGYPNAIKSSVVGAKVFRENCAICHQIGGEGALIGPQLDGIGNWGLTALNEKVLDPNRNISKAFVNYSVTLRDGTVRQGLFRRVEGNMKVFADLTGQEFSIPSDQIVQQKALPFTLMPDNLLNTISESDYYNLMEYLLEQK